MDARGLVIVVALTVAACGAPDTVDGYAWDGQRVLCSQGIDDLNGGPTWDVIDQQLRRAANDHVALMLHAHKPTITVSPEEIDRVLTTAKSYGLDFVTFRELVPGPPRGALALAFDDNAPDLWVTLRDVFAAHGARLTFFVSRYSRLSDAEHDEIRLLASDGHDIEPHTVNHLHAADYVAAHGLDAYITDEVLPSFQVLIDAGYPAPTTLAYPFGDHTPEIDAAVLRYVDKVRTTAGQQCANSGQLGAGETVGE